MKQKQDAPQPYFRSKVFIRLFLSYALLIFVFLAVYTGWYLYTYQKNFAESRGQALQQKAAAWGTLMDQQLVTAQNLCSVINTSDNCRDALQTVYLEKKPIDAMQLYKVLGELKRLKGSSGNRSIYNIALIFQDDMRAFTAGSVVALGSRAQRLSTSPWMGISSVSSLLGVTGSTNIVMNKEFFIYAENYTAFSSTSPKGTVLVLFDRNTLSALAQSALGNVAGMSVVAEGETVLTFGEETSLAFEAPSLVAPSIRYLLYAPPAAMRAPLLADGLLPLLVVALLGVVFLCVTYRLARNYYRPISNLGEMIQRPNGSDNEIAEILDGVRDLIGERNGYREKMITISPYARQGMLHSLLNGKGRDSQLDVLIDEQFVALSKAYFTLGIANVSYTGQSEVPSQRLRDAQELISHVAVELSGEDCTVVCCPRTLRDLLVIVNSNEETATDELFYQLYAKAVEALDDSEMAVTIGVSARESDLERLPEACQSAERALEQMLTGGRNSVYFDEGNAAQASAGYYFPRDALKRMVKGLREGDAAELNALLDELYQHNVRGAELAPSELRLMVDELHLTTRNALQAVFELSTTHVRVERIREAATIDEIFNYYRHVFERALEESAELLTPETTNALEDEVCAWLEQNLFSPELSLNALANQFGVSTKMVGLICKKRYGQTFLQYVRNQQIHRAAELLQTTSLPLEEIAQQCGFTNLLTFRRNFKAVMNVNPSDFRK